MGYLYLIRHPAPQVDPECPTEDWHLSEEGVQQVVELALAPFWPKVQAIYCSTQQKASKPAQDIGKQYGIPVVPLPELAEVTRPPHFYSTPAEFMEIVRRFFDEPKAPMEGWESSSDALARFNRGIEQIAATWPEENIAILSHGMILNLYTAMAAGNRPLFSQWAHIGFTDVAVVDRTAGTLLAPFFPTKALNALA
jgi:broad specificity phosphatase PhoE